MTSQNSDFYNRLNQLNESGLNLFASMQMSLLSMRAKENLTSAGIFFSDEDCICMIGHGGRKLWKKIPAPPIDDYSVEITTRLFPEARILFPHNKWQLPLQQIGRELNLGRQSVLGIDINPDYGLWFAYRCLFLTKEKIPSTTLESFDSPCEACTEKPCLLKPEFSSARLACPYKKEHRYSDEQLHYHQSQLPRR